MQKIIYCEPKYNDQGTVSFTTVNDLLEEGYKVISIIAQHCAIATGSTYTSKIYGGYAVLVEKDDDEVKL